MDQTDVSHLRRCVELARTARQAGNEPFGSLILPAGVPRLALSSREVFERGDLDIEVDGPCEELHDEAMAVFDAFWGPQEATPPPS